MKRIEVVGAVILNDKKEVLCALRSQSMSLGGVWEFPGGKIEPGESPQKALVREIREELLCKIEVGAFVASCIRDHPKGTLRLDTYFARVVEGIPTKTEHEALLWLQISMLHTLRWAPADMPTVQKLTEQFVDGGLRPDSTNG